MNTLFVELGTRRYPIYIGTGLLGDPDLLAPHIAAAQVMIITNEVVAPLYLEPLQQALVKYQVHTKVLPDGEAHKNLQVLETIFDAMLATPCDRHTTVIALGGGVIGDIAGFAAACYQRGVPLVQIPTTLLAQVDSSVGGKTAVNHTRGKNMIGAFYQPTAVIADIQALDTLPDREFRAGVAEVIKYGLIRDAEFFGWLESNIQKLLERDAVTLTHAIERSCRNKADVVAADEREKGERALLNLGHTFGHAIETATGYREWLHGEAVATGMIMAADLSLRLGDLDEGSVHRIRALFETVGLPTVPPPLSPEAFLSHMAVDKKVTHGMIRLVLLREIGAAYINDGYSPDALSQTLHTFSENAAVLAAK